MEKSKVWQQREGAREMIVKALETLSPGDPVLYNKEACGGSEYHLRLTRQQIDSGVVAFITLNTMSAGSQGDFDLYRLLHKYILEPNIREKINAIIKTQM